MDGLRTREEEKVGSISLRGEPIFARRSEYFLIEMRLRDRELWRGFWRQLTGREEVVWKGPFLEGQRVMVLFRGGLGEEEIVLPVQGELYLESGGRRVLKVGRPGLSWRMGAIELGRRLEEDHQGGSGEEERAAKKMAVLQRPLRVEQYQGRRLGLNRGIWGGSACLALDPGLKEVVVGLRGEYLSLREILNLTGLPRDAVLVFLNALQAGGLLCEAPLEGQGGSNPYDRLGLHWTAHEHEIRSRYREWIELARIEGEISRSEVERAYDQLHRPEWRQSYRRKHYPSPIVGEVGDHFRRKITGLRSGEEHCLEETIDVCRRVLELDPDDRDVRALLVTLLSQAERRRRAKTSL